MGEPPHEIDEFLQALCVMRIAALSGPVKPVTRTAAVAALVLAAVAAWWWTRAPLVPAVGARMAPLVRTLQVSARVATVSRVEVGSTLRVMSSMRHNDSTWVRPAKIVVNQRLRDVSGDQPGRSFRLFSPLDAGQPSEGPARGVLSGRQLGQRLRFHGQSFRPPRDGRWSRRWQ